MHVVVLSNAVADDATADERDVLVQVESVSAALLTLGHRVEHWTCTLDLGDLAERLRAARPDVVFNLVESLAGSDRLAPAAALVLDALEVPYTGSPLPALLAAASKIETKQRLHAAGLPTPAWIVSNGESEATLLPKLNDNGPRTAIIKPVWEHASLGMDDSAVMSVSSTDELRRHVHEWSQRLGRPCFAEAYIDGREFNLSVLAGPDGPEVLPPAEIDFSAFPAGKPRIVGYQAKWQADSFEYQHTLRRFDLPAADAPLANRLRDLARRTWSLFGLRGYARVDFRVDGDGEPWILEINANPCLSPDAGFAAAISEGSLSYKAALERIIADAFLGRLL